MQPTDLFGDQGDVNLSIGAGSLLGPVHVALLPAPLQQVGDHHDHVHVLLPHHSPECLELEDFFSI